MKFPPTPNTIKKSLNDSIQFVTQNKDSYVCHPGHDMTRSRKLPFSTCLELILNLADKDNREELCTFFQNGDIPSDSALCSQRVKIKPKAFQDILYNSI